MPNKTVNRNIITGCLHKLRVHILFTAFSKFCTEYVLATRKLLKIYVLLLLLKL